MGGSLHVIPLKNGCFRVVHVHAELTRIDGAVRLSPATYARWLMAWETWFNAKGYRLAISPEMWMKESRRELNDG